MAGPDNRVRRDDGVVRARLEAANVDATDLDVSIKMVTVQGEYEIDGETHEWEDTFPVVELEGYEEYDQYRFATPGTSWSEEDVVDEETIESVDLSEIDSS